MVWPSTPAPGVPGDRGGWLRLDQLVVRRLGISRRQARVAIAAGRVRAGGRPARIVARSYPPNIALDLDDVPPPPAGAAPPAAAGLPVIAVAKLWVAVDKPAGLLAERDRFGAPAVETLLPRCLAAQGQRPEVYLVHRLDAGTSGVMVLARRPRAARHFGAVFAERRAEKLYLALVAGHLGEPTVIDAPIGRVVGTRHGVVAGGRPARTEVVPLAWGATATYVELRPQSGRTHQLRVHLAHLGHPIVGDRLYGGPMWTPRRQPLRRLMLHARLLRLPSPEDDAAPLQLVAPPPAALAAACRAFAVGAGGASVVSAPSALLGSGPPWRAPL